MNSSMWYSKPASEWKEGLPIGNGFLAGMVMGGIEQEYLHLNHERLWRGKHRNKDIEPQYQHLEKIRQLFFEGKVFEAGTLANEILGGLGGVSGEKNRVDPYQPLGDLIFNFNHKNVSNYRRGLKLDEAVVFVSYSIDGNYLLREFLAHAIYKVIVIRFTSTGIFDANIILSRIEDPECEIRPWSKEYSLGFTGKFIEGVQFAVEVRLFSKSGSTSISLQKNEVQLDIKNCNEVIFLLTGDVSHNSESPLSKCSERIDSIPPLSWDELLKSHIKEYQRLYNRVSFKFGKSQDELPIDERLLKFRSGYEDSSLYPLLFNFGRYLLISSSFGAELPANLQGKWNDELNPPWECDYHHDINLQMNYWAVEVCNLTECAEPLFAHVERFMPHGKIAAKRLYNCDGVWLPLQIDPWGRATPESKGWDVWIGAAAWLAQHFWWHYEYSLDKQFLKKRAFPLFKEVAAFYETYLVSDSEGRLVPIPSQSPENKFVGGTKPVSLCIGATLDLELIYNLLSHAISASETLGVDEEKREKWYQILNKIPPLRIGKYGQLQEWLEDYDEVEPGHRHISHLFALFPGEQITPEETPELAAAAEVSLERRITNGGGNTGWSSAWISCCFSRLGKGDKALQNLRRLLSIWVTNSLLGLHPPGIFQIDANFGATAAIAEMLFQSHKGIIRILPALPSFWQDGEVNGLCARGGFVADISWENGKPKKVSIFSKFGGRCRLKFHLQMNMTVTSEKQVLFKTDNATNTVAWETAAEKYYEIFCG